MHSAPPDLRRNLGTSRHWLRIDLEKLDPTTDPIAYAVDGASPHGRALFARLGIEQTPYAREGWCARATLLDALRAVSPIDAVALERAPGTDVGRWTVVYADETIRVAVESVAGLAELVRAPPLAGCIAGLRTCLDGGDHVWDAEIVYDEELEADEDNTESACSKCGAPAMMWSETHGP